MESYIYLRRVRFHACHGVMPQEARVGGDFELSLRAKCDIGQAMLTDDVAHTVSYADLYELARREMGVPSRLLEHVAGRIARAVMRAFPQVEAVDLWLTKQNPPMGARCDGAGVELHLTNNDIHDTTT